MRRLSPPPVGILPFAEAPLFVARRGKHPSVVRPARAATFESLSRFARELPRRVEAANSAAKETIMLNRTIFAAVLVAGAMLAPIASFAAAPPAAPPCVFQEHHVLSVTPYRVEERRIKSTFTRLGGAQLYVQAEPGLTAEWLRLEVARHRAQMHDPATMNDCALDVGNVRVEVNSAGPGFSVRLIAVDPNNAEEVLRRARLLLG
jgi:hypothetical protein